MVGGTFVGDEYEVACSRSNHIVNIVISEWMGIAECGLRIEEKSEIRNPKSEIIIFTE